MRVLLADNDPEWLELLAFDLDCEGHEVVATVRDGDAALERAGNGDIDIVVVDYRMPPGPDGLAVTRELRRRHPHLRVVMFSNYDDATLIQEVEKLGASFVLKPAIRTLRALLVS